MGRAYRDGKDVRALETYAEQIGFLAGDPPAVQVAALGVALDGLPAFSEDLAAFKSAWVAGNADLMLSLSLAPLAAEPLLEQQTETLIYKRNQRMAGQIREFIREGGNFLVVVGALHMGGPRGLINQLQADYPVRQISETKEGSP